MNIVKTITSTAPDPTVGCSGGYCPSFLLTDDGRVLVQGYVVAAGDKDGLAVPSGEDIVSMPLSTLKNLFKNLSHE